MKIIAWALTLIAVFYFLSFRLTRVPPGINIDESSIGYNASLISNHLRDENNRFLPVFILTLGGKDWKQPVRIYTTAILFKLLGKSYFNLRLVSVIYALSSLIIFFFILKLFFKWQISLLGTILFLSSPSFLLQSHLALENIDLLPPMLLWLYFLFSFSLKPKGFKLLLAGGFLGISFYAYKGMHAIVPIYFGLSLIYLFYLTVTRKLSSWKAMIFFLLGILPFLLPLKWLQTHYAGAIYDPQAVSVPSIDNAVYTYLASFDFSFLFFKGDKMLTHSTGHHGMFLFPTLILFFWGFLELFKEKKPWFYFTFASLALTPILLTSVGSVYRASRLLSYLPLFTLIFTLGLKGIFSLKEKWLKILISFVLMVSLGANYLGFLKNYWFEYPKLVSSDFSPNFNESMEKLSRLSKENKKQAFLEYNDFNVFKTDFDFFREVYFPEGNLKIWQREREPFPENGLVLTRLGGSGELKTLETIPSLESGQQEFYIVGKDN